MTGPVDRDVAGPVPVAPVRFGIKARLFLAVGLLAALTVLAGIVAWLVFLDIEQAVNRVTGRSLPGMVSALTLAEKSSEIATAAPGLVVADSTEELIRAHERMAQRLDDMSTVMASLQAAGVEPERVVSLAGLRAQLALTLEDLVGAVEGSLRQRDRRRALAQLLSARHQHFTETLEPLIDDTVFDLVMSGDREVRESRRSITRLVEGGVGRIDALLTIEAQSNLAAGLLAQVAHSRDGAQIGPLEERYIAAAAAIGRSLNALAPRGGISGGSLGRLANASRDLLDHGTGADGVFARRRAQLAGQGNAADGALPLLEIAALEASHEALLLELAPIVDDAGFDLVLATDEVLRTSSTMVTGMIDIGTTLLHTLLTVRAEGNHLWGLLTQAGSVTDPGVLGPLQERYTAAEATIARMMTELPRSMPAAPIREAADGLLMFGQGEDSLFVVRGEELRHLAQAQRDLRASRLLAERIAAEVQAVVAQASLHSSESALRSADAIRTGQAALVAIVVLSLVAAALLLGLYVMPQILRPLERITAAMTALAGGDTGVDIPGRKRRDELGRMAEALGVFRDTAIEMQESNLREIRETRTRLQDAIESISEGFSLYDAEDRLVVCNAKYQMLMHPELAGEVVPGMTFEEIIRRSADRGLVPAAVGRVDEWVAERLARHRDPGPAHIHQRGELWILVSERKTEDGGTVALYSDITALKQREQELAEKTVALEQLSSQLAKYLSPQVYESIFTGRQEVKIESRRKKLTIFFSDIAGFTETTDRMQSEDLTQILNQYLTEMSKIAFIHGATIDKYVGDAIVIFFGDPTTRGVQEDALACVRMALQMRQRMEELQREWRNSGIERPLRCRMGIHTGYCTVGNFGSEDRMDYTIIGGSVNLAARLEAAAPSGEILISYETHALVQEAIACEEHGRIQVKGIAEPVATWRVRDSIEGEARNRNRIRAAQPHLAFDLDPDAMSAAERAEAAALLRRALEQIGDADQRGGA